MKCDLTGKKIIFGNNISHSNKKTRRTFLPNIKKVSFKITLPNSTNTKINFKLSLSHKGMRTINKYNGIVNYFFIHKNKVLKYASNKFLKIKNQIFKLLNQ